MTINRTVTPCVRKCTGGRKCVCAAGHSAPCICNRADCQCHQPAAYGLVAVTRGGRVVYVPAADAFGPRFGVNP